MTGRLSGVLALPRRYPVTILWAVLMIVAKSGTLERLPPVLSTLVVAIAAPVMLPAYIVGFGWLALGGLIGIGEAVPLWFEIAGVLVVAGAYVAVDRAIRAVRARTAGSRQATPRR